MINQPYADDLGQGEQQPFFLLDLQDTTLHAGNRKGYIKVKTISFGQSLDQNMLSIAHRVSEQAKYFVVMGSSLKVSPANSFIKVAKANKAKIIILNKDKTPFDDYADIVINDYLENIYEQIK